MCIGIDINGVLTNIEEFELNYGSKYFYENGNLNRIRFDLENENRISEKDSDAFWSKAIYDYIKIKPRDFACEVINKLKQDGYTLCIVTNRISDLSYCSITPDEMRKTVMKWLEENAIYYDELLLSCIYKLDILIEERKEDYMQGVDTILNYAIEYSKTKIQRK